MRPKPPQAPSDDLFRSSLKAILDPEHELLKLAQLIDWDRFDDAFGRFYHERKGRRGLPTRPPLGDAMHRLPGKAWPGCICSNT